MLLERLKKIQSDQYYSDFYIFIYKNETGNYDYLIRAISWCINVIQLINFCVTTHDSQLITIDNQQLATKYSWLMINYQLNPTND